jgi:hypothetical protein
MNMGPWNAVYNARIHCMSVCSPRWLRWSAARLVLLFFGLWAAAQTSPSAVARRDLAGKIAALVSGEKTITLEFANRSTLPAKDTDFIRQQLLTDLATLGVKTIQGGQASAMIRITLSENVTNVLAVAEITRPASPSSIAIVSWPKAQTQNAPTGPALLTLRKTLIWSGPQPILDATLFEDPRGGSHLLILDPAAVTAYRFDSGQWQRDQTLPIQHAVPWPQDLRGRLWLYPDQRLSIFLPGLLCEGSRATTTTFDCHASDDPWPLNANSTVRAFFAPNRNFFTGALSPGIGKLSSTVKFFTAASVPQGNSALWIFTAVDGSIHLLDGITDQSNGWKWGNDIAAVTTSCGAGTQVLVTLPDAEPFDTIRAYELLDRNPVPVSTVVEFSGKITALWTESRGNSAIAITHDPKTGDYAAFRLTVGCG